jgi:hypothetical protein
MNGCWTVNNIKVASRPIFVRICGISAGRQAIVMLRVNEYISITEALTGIGTRNREFCLLFFSGSLQW